MENVENHPAAPIRKTLLDMCREVASECEWQTYTAGRHLSFSALRREFSKDFSECAPGTRIILYADRQYADRKAAEAYLQSRHAAADLLKRAVEWMRERQWVAEARRAGEPCRARIELNLVLTLGSNIDATALELEGVNYLGLAFRPASADIYEDIVSLIQRQEPQMDLSSSVIADFQTAVEATLGRPIPKATFRDAMRTAGAAPGWFKPGRRRGSLSNPDSD